MQVIFVRHGEATDDVEGRYGGWYDPGLSPKGIEGAKTVANFLAEKKIPATIIYSSPFRRTNDTAKTISEKLSLPLETNVYLKERNTYGLLCGERVDEAKVKYPELVSALEEKREVLGFESYEFLLKRISALLVILSSCGHECVICVTHGKLLGGLFADFLKKPAKKFNDNCVAQIEISSPNDLKIIATWGIDF